MCVCAHTRVCTRVRARGCTRARAWARARLAGFNMKPVRVSFQTYTGFISNPYGFQMEPIRESLGRSLETPSIRNAECGIRNALARQVGARQRGEGWAGGGVRGVPGRGVGVGQARGRNYEISSGASERTRLCTTLTWRAWCVRGGGAVAQDATSPRFHTSTPSTLQTSKLSKRLRQQPPNPSTSVESVFSCADRVQEHAF